MGIVAKFGGSSVKSAQAIERCVDIVVNFPEMEIIVVSATYQTTNKLESLTKESLIELFNHHKNMAFYLDLEKNIHEKLEEINQLALDTLSKKENYSSNAEYLDQLYVVGEMWSSWLFFGAISKKLIDRDVAWLDVTEVIKTNSEFGHAAPDMARIEDNVSSLKKDTLYITQGFIGKDDKGSATSLGREGSDYSATLLAAATKSQAVIIWTDVPGISTIDPRIDNTAIVIPQMDYKMATTMATSGAKVLFEKTLNPVAKLNIPVFVKSSLEPELPGTCITHNAPDGNFSLAVKDNFVTFICDNAEEIEMDGIVERGDNYLVFEADDPISLAREIHHSLIKGI